MEDLTSSEADLIVSNLTNLCFSGRDRQAQDAASILGKLAGHLTARTRSESVTEILESLVYRPESSTERTDWLKALTRLVSESAEVERIGYAMAYAHMVHLGQKDKLGAPYTDHLRAVAAAIPTGDHLAQQVAWLHDSLEDTDAQADVIEALVGAEGLAAVQAITHRKHEPRADYYARVKQNPLALRVKLADVAHNSDPKRLAQLDEKTRERLADKYAAALLALA